jgi:hypothetical protein
MAVPISNVTRRQVYAPSGTGGAGPYAFTFEILANTDIAVFKDDTLLTLTTHYTVTINANGTGSVTITATGLALAPTSPTQYAIVGNRTIQRTTDFVTGGDFFANTLNDEMDQQTIFAQQNAEGVQRSLAAPQTDPTSINMTLPRASLRANKALGFDANGNPVISDTLGTNRGNWAAGVLYYVRDIVKDTTTNNIFQVITEHTSSGSQPITTNVDVAKWTLLVDAASATTSATNAAASASAASTSASNASTSASNASTSASNAASSASAASTSASNAAASYDSFDDRYLGAKASAPTLDNDGNALLTGAIYWDTTLGVIRVYSGTAWQSVNAPATIARTAITATASQTVLSVATYTPGINTMSVFVNGVKLSLSEYTETNANTVTLTTGLALNDEVEVFSYQVNAIGSLGASSVTFTQAGTNATARNAQVKLQEFVSVKDFGAVGNGSVDDRAAIQACLDYCYANNKCVYIPNGTYLVNDSLVLYDYQVIRGQGWRKTMITGALANKSIIRTQYGEAPTYAQRTIGWDIGEFSVTNSGVGSIGLNFGNVGYSNVINMGVYDAETGLKCTQRTYYTCFINLSCQANFVCADLQSDGGANEFINPNFGFGGGVGNAGVKITSGSWKFNGGTVDTNSANAGWFFKVGENGYPLTASLQISNVYVEGSTSAQNVLHFYDNTITTNIFGMERRGAVGPVVYENTGIYEGIYMDSAGQPNPGGQFTRRVTFTRNPGTGVIDGTIRSLEGSVLKVFAADDTASGGLSVGKLFIGGGGDTTLGIYSGSGNPESVITAPIGSLYLNTSGGTSRALFVKGSGSGNTGWLWVPNFNGTALFPATATGLSDGGMDLGSAFWRWGTVFAVTGTINTSDEREKQDIAVLDEAEKRVAQSLKGLVKKFRFKDAVSKKGDAARIHVGVVAQEVANAFQAENLNPMRYGIVCYDEWEAEIDEEGHEIRPAGNRYGVRYEELLAFIIAAM